jgi:hypothetical protein
VPTEPGAHGDAPGHTPKELTMTPDGISVKVSPDLAAYAAGEIPASKVRCALCETAPCGCPPFGTPEYFALIDKRHGH